MEPMGFLIAGACMVGFGCYAYKQFSENNPEGAMGWICAIMWCAFAVMAKL